MNVPFIGVFHAREGSGAQLVAASTNPKTIALVLNQLILEARCRAKADAVAGPLERGKIATLRLLLAQTRLPEPFTVMDAEGGQP